MEIIKSKQNNKIKYLKSLQLKKNRVKNSQYIIEGKHLCQMAQEVGLLQEVFLIKDEIYNFAKKTYISQEIIRHITNLVSPQNILGLANMSNYVSFEGDKYIIIDDIQDPGNLGSILRSALAFGFKNVVLSLHTIDLYNPKVLRSAQGANFKLNIQKTNILEFMKANDFHYIATDLAKKSKDLSKIDQSKPKALILGNEGAGIRDEVSSQSTHNYIINIENIDSLNVVVAGSIIMEKLK